MPLNPVSVSLCATDVSNPQTAATALDALVATAVAAIKSGVPKLLANQVTIVPLGTIYDATNTQYVCSATVLYSTS